MSAPRLPEDIAGLIARLGGQGFPAYAVGGCVRDALLGRTPHDWDVCTAARPEQVKAALPELRTLDTGLRHGTVTVLLPGGPVEVTTFRRDGGYSDHRRPDAVAFTGDLCADLRRRDFTINAMAWDGARLVDPCGGREDLARGVLRAVGDPAARFGEDALRILRALRFAAVYGFAVEEETARALTAARGDLRFVAAERVRAELWKLLPGGCAPVLRAFAPVFAVVLPELAPMFGFDQRNRHHIYDVWEHTLHALAAAPADPLLRLALLLHDCGKPACFSLDAAGQGHFYGHAEKSAALADGALRRLRFDNGVRERAVRLIALHDHDLPPTEKGVRRWLLRLPPADLRLLIALKRADNAAQSPRYARAAEWDAAERILDGVLERGACRSLAGLAVRGDDLLARGLRGPEVGAALRFLLDAVAGGAENEKGALLALLDAREGRRGAPRG